jgi:hypothetical protein
MIDSYELSFTAVCFFQHFSKYRVETIQPYTLFGTTYFQEAIAVDELDFADLDITAKLINKTPAAPCKNALVQVQTHSML